jgi:hypothetical protein
MGGDANGVTQKESNGMQPNQNLWSYRQDL